MRERAQAALTWKVGAVLLVLESWSGDKEVADVAATGTQAVGQGATDEEGTARMERRIPKHKAVQWEGEGPGSAWPGRGAGPSFSVGKQGSLKVPGQIQPPGGRGGSNLD